MIEYVRAQLSCAVIIKVLSVMFQWIFFSQFLCEVSVDFLLPVSVWCFCGFSALFLCMFQWIFYSQLLCDVSMDFLLCFYVMFQWIFYSQFLYDVSVVFLLVLWDCHKFSYCFHNFYVMFQEFSYSDSHHSFSVTFKCFSCCFCALFLEFFLLLSMFLCDVLRVFQFPLL